MGKKISYQAKIKSQNLQSFIKENIKKPDISTKKVGVNNKKTP